MADDWANKLNMSLEQFMGWLDTYGETSQDQYDFWAAPWGQRAKAFYYRLPLLGTGAVMPFVLLDAFAPATRKWFHPRQRFPIADAHYAMGFAYRHRATGSRADYNRAVHFLAHLQRTRCPEYQHYCWGYPFDWVTVTGTFPANTPLITTTPYVYEALSSVYDVDGDRTWLQIMHSIADHARCDIHDVKVGPTAWACAYTPMDQRRVINANAYRAFILADASRRFGTSQYWQVGERNLNFVLQAQQPDGSWLYADDGNDRFIDHFHTCFVLKNLVKIARLTDNAACHRAIQRGLAFYLEHLIDHNDLPKPFDKTQRMTVYRRDLYDYAESVNLGLLLRNEFGEFHRILSRQLDDLTCRWQKQDGSFRTRQLLIGWNNVPYHRWAQSQMFRSLCLWRWQALQTDQQRQSRRSSG